MSTEDSVRRRAEIVVKAFNLDLDGLAQIVEEAKYDETDAESTDYINLVVTTIDRVCAEKLNKNLNDTMAYVEAFLDKLTYETPNDREFRKKWIRLTRYERDNSRKSQLIEEIREIVPQNYEHDFDMLELSFATDTLDIDRIMAVLDRVNRKSTTGES